MSIAGRRVTKSRGRARPKPSRPSFQTVRITYMDMGASRVGVAGSFNGWKPNSHEMVPMGNGSWAVDLQLAPGTYEYRFVVDGRWLPDPKADHAVLNPFGERNSLLSVSRKFNSG